MILNHDDLLKMLDSLLREPTEFWNDFYSDRGKRVPFFANIPDENLVSYFDSRLFLPGNVLELGCGPGRNAIYFAEKGCRVDAVDLAQESLNWAEERASKKNISVNFIKKNIFELDFDQGSYDIVYDSGCFHHIAPHRRLDYINLVKKALKPNGHFAITCFVEGGELGGTDLTDWDVYRLQSLKGGLGFTQGKLRAVFNDFKEIEIRKMREVTHQKDVFGVSGLLTALFQNTSKP